MLESSCLNLLANSWQLTNAPMRVDSVYMYTAVAQIADTQNTSLSGPGKWSGIKYSKQTGWWKCITMQVHHTPASSRVTSPTCVHINIVDNHFVHGKLVTARSILYTALKLFFFVIRTQ